MSTIIRLSSTVSAMLVNSLAAIALTAVAVGAAPAPGPTSSGGYSDAYDSWVPATRVQVDNNAVSCGQYDSPMERCPSSICALSGSVCCTEDHFWPGCKCPRTGTERCLHKTVDLTDSRLVLLPSASQLRFKVLWLGCFRVQVLPAGWLVKQFRRSCVESNAARVSPSSKLHAYLHTLSETRTRPHPQSQSHYLAPQQCATWVMSVGNVIRLSRKHHPAHCWPAWCQHSSWRTAVSWLWARRWT